MKCEMCRCCRMGAGPNGIYFSSFFYFSICMSTTAVKDGDDGGQRR